MDEAPEDELFEDGEGPEPCPESQEHAPEAKCARSEATEQPHRTATQGGRQSIDRSESVPSRAQSM